MEAVTRSDREQELNTLLAQMKAHPERDWSETRARADVLRETLRTHAKD